MTGNRRVISIWDERFESGPRHVQDLTGVPEELLAREVMQRYGIASHLSVYENNEDGSESCLNHGERYHER